MTQENVEYEQKIGDHVYRKINNSWELHYAPIEYDSYIRKLNEFECDIMEILAYKDKRIIELENAISLALEAIQFS